MKSTRLSLSVGDYFLNQDIENILFARDQTQKILDEIISVIKPGLRESEVYALAKDILLEDDDIAFVDIGPLIGELEGDLGVTLVFGNNEKLYSLKSASEKLFAYGLEFFKSHAPTGIEMQEFISSKAREMGYISLLESTGHLIGNFSHSAIWNQGVATYTEKMQPGIWILEVQIKDPELPYAAFYENILI